MKNLFSLLSEDLQKKLKDFKVYKVTIEYNEVNMSSFYEMDQSYITAVENELAALGYEIINVTF